MSVSEMITRKSWEEFQAAGLLWFVNRMLHLVGWAIVVDSIDDNGKIINAYPARVKFRGFSNDIESGGFIQLTEHIKENIDELVEETKQ